MMMTLEKDYKKIADVVCPYERKKKIAIYPYGKLGKIARLVLEMNHFEHFVMIDEKLCKQYEGCISLKEFVSKAEYDEYSVLLCNTNREYYEELRRQLYEVVDKRRVIDVFGEGLFSPLRFQEPRAAALECAAREIAEKKIPGNVAEAGVFRGDFSKYINELFPDKTLYLIDTFEGFDKKDIDADKLREFSNGNQDWSDTSVQIVLEKMKHPEQCMVKKGWFPEIMKDVEDSFCFVSLDMDLYQPIYEGLCFFYPKLEHGGYIFVHDCRNEYYPGARQAVIDFCNEYTLGYTMLQDTWGTAVICK